MCLLVRPSRLTVIIVVHGRSINTERPATVCQAQEKKPRDFWSGEELPFLFFLELMKYKTAFVIITPSVLVFIPPPVHHWIGGSSAGSARRDCRGIGEIGVIISLFCVE